VDQAILEVDAPGRHLKECWSEIRPLFELEDFPVSPAEKADGWRQQERRFRDKETQA